MLVQNKLTYSVGRPSWLKKIRLLISLTPFAWVSFFYLFVLRVYIQLGKIPAYNLPDPKDLGYSIHHTILFFSIPICLLSIILYPVIVFFSRKTQPVSLKEIFLFLLGVSLFTIQIYFDPLQLQIWFMD